MSRHLLEHLNRGRQGLFARWLEAHPGQPRIAWYPSAGFDYRDLLYLHPRFSARHPVGEREPAAPDIFIHTDYLSFAESFPKSSVLHEDKHARMVVRSCEELPPLSRCETGSLEGIVSRPDLATMLGRVFFLEIEVRSDTQGETVLPVLYVFTENASFYANVVQPCFGRLSHILHIRYGNSLGGCGLSSGIWLLNILEPSGCEAFVTDNGYDQPNWSDRKVEELYPELAGDHGALEGGYGRSPWRTLRTLSGRLWSDVGRVDWRSPPEP